MYDVYILKIFMNFIDYIYCLLASVVENMHIKLCYVLNIEK